MKKNSIRFIALAMALCLIVGLATAAFAASDDAVIDYAMQGSLTIYKYDFTAADEGGVNMSGFVTNGTSNPSVESVMAPYAVEGVEFTILKVADIEQFTLPTGVQTLYSMDKTLSADLLTALGLTGGTDSVAEADALDAAAWHFTSEKLNGALHAAMVASPSATKDALENYITGNGGTALSVTDVHGKTTASGLELGCYLVLETMVPQQVNCTAVPAFISVPTVNPAGNAWNYALTIYPKNETNEPTLEKTVRESRDFGGAHGGTNTITDGYDHVATASGGDKLEYQILSTLPTITSNATRLTEFKFTDHLASGLSWDTDSVKVEWYKDAACTQPITTWDISSGKFDVAFTGSVAVFTLTASGLAEVNTAISVWPATDAKSGYSDCTMRLVYTANVTSTADVIYGDAGNGNRVALEWKRTNQNFPGTLTDDTHVFTYGLELTKEFNDGTADFSAVQFVLKNDTDNKYVVASYNAVDRCYYMTGYADAEADATRFTPDANGKITVMGLENDLYLLSEISTKSGYMLLARPIEVEIATAATTSFCASGYAASAHTLLTASGSFGGVAVTMLDDTANASANAIVAGTVINYSSNNLPQSGEMGLIGTVVIATVCGVFGIFGIACVSRRKKV